MYREFERLQDYTDFLNKVMLRCPDDFDNLHHPVGSRFWLDFEKAFFILKDRLWFLEKKIGDKTKIPPYVELLDKAYTAYKNGENDSGQRILDEAISFLNSRRRKPKSEGES